MIYKKNSRLFIECDICKEKPKKWFNSWVNLGNYRRDKGWNTIENSSGWIDICYKCSEEDK